MVSYERRKEKRFPISAPARLELNGFGQKSVLNLTTANVSAGGLYFETHNPRPTGTPVPIEIVLPHRIFRRFGGNQRVLIEGDGRVLRAEASGMAISFEGDYRIRQLQ
jgi:hypothetical protein